MTTRTWVSLLIFAALAALLAMFLTQNAARTTQLSLNLGVAAWQLRDPVPVVALLVGTFAGGFFLGAVAMLRRSFRQGRRIRELEQQIALGNAPEWR